MRGRANLTKRIAVLLCAVLLLPSFITIFSCFSDMTKVSAANTSGLLPDPKLPTMEVGVMSTPAFVRLKETREKLPEGKQYRVESSDKSICVPEIQESSWDHENWWSVKGLKKGTTTITLYETVNGTEKKIDTYRVNVMPELTVKALDATGNAGRVQTFATGKAEMLETKAELPSGSVLLETVGDMFEVPIYYENPLATYKMTPADKTIVSTMQDGTLKAVKAGTTEISVTETLNGKTRKLGTISVKVEAVKVKLKAKEVMANYLAPLSLKELVDSNSYSVEYTYETKDTDVVSEAKGTSSVKASKIGTANITVYAELAEGRKKVGTVAVNFAPAKTKSGTVEIEWEKYNYNYSVLNGIVECVANPTTGNFSILNNVEYSAVLKDSNQFDRNSFTKRKDGTYLIYEKYKELIVPAGTAKVKFVDSIDPVKNPTLAHKTFSMGLYDMGEHISYFISPYDFSGKIKYSYTVKDKKIVKVERDTVIPLKKGKTTVTIKAKVDGKTKTVGTITVTVADKAAKLRTKEEIVAVQPQIPISFFVTYYHPKATYSCKISDTSIVSFDKKNQAFKVKKAGEAKITITENYNGKTVKLGTVTVTAVK